MRAPGARLNICSFRNQAPFPGPFAWCQMAHKPGQLPLFRATFSQMSLELVAAGFELGVSKAPLQTP